MLQHSNSHVLTKFLFGGVGGVFLVSQNSKSQVLTKFSLGGRGGGILGFSVFLTNSRPELLKSSLRSSNPGGGGGSSLARKHVGVFLVK